MNNETNEHVTKPRYILGGLSSFIPLQDEHNAIVSRGQRVPSLIQSRGSERNLFSLGRRNRAFSTSDDESIEATTALDSPARRPILRHGHTTIDRDRDLDLNEERRMTHAAEVLMTPHMRSMRLIGSSNPRYRWQQYYKTPEQLKQYRKPIRQYYERVNFLIAHYLYIDRLLDSSLIHKLMSEYQDGEAEERQELQPIKEQQEEAASPMMNGDSLSDIDDDSKRGARAEDQRQRQRQQSQSQSQQTKKMKRTPKNLYKIPDEQSPLLQREEEGDVEAQEDEVEQIDVPFEEDEDLEAGSSIVTVAIYINLVANILLLAGKIAVIVLTDSLSVLASLVDAALDFLSTAIVWVTTYLIQRQDQYAYPIGRRRLEPVGVLVFSVIMITSFFQVGLECLSRLTSGDRSIVELTVPAVAIMISTVVIKGFCYFWCRLIKNSSVQALAQDALTDIVFNTFSIIFPLIGFYASIWWLDALGGLLLSCYVIFNWSKSASEHIRNLSGAAATADERNILLYLTMRFAKTIRYIQGLQAYHAGDKLNVEVDIVLEEDTSLKDSHDLSESLQYVLESVPSVDRAFVHSDYKRVNLPSHMNQQG